MIIPETDHLGDVHPERPPHCQLHGEKYWCECEQCGGEGLDGHDCGDDTCCCLHPEDNECCGICRGKGGWWRCYTCAPETEDEHGS